LPTHPKKKRRINAVSDGFTDHPVRKQEGGKKQKRARKGQKSGLSEKDGEGNASGEEEPVRRGRKSIFANVREEGVLNVRRGGGSDAKALIKGM